MSLQKAAFLDRDGVINIDHAYVHTPEEFTFIPGVFEACRQLQSAGYLLIIATNQSGIGRGYYSEEDFVRLCDWMKGKFARQGSPLISARAFWWGKTVYKSLKPHPSAPTRPLVF